MAPRTALAAFTAATGQDRRSQFVEGAPVVDESGQFLKDDQGAILLPRLDSPSLRAFALDVGGRYRQARLDDNDLRGLGLLDDPRHLRDNGQTLQLDSWADQGYWLLLPLLLLVACAGRRGWLFCLPLLFMLQPQPAQAMSFTDLWLRPDQQGLRLLQQNKPLLAVEHFSDPLWQGVALYRAGDFAGTVAALAASDTALGWYDRGNAEMLQPFALPAPGPWCWLLPSSSSGLVRRHR